MLNTKKIAINGKIFSVSNTGLARLAKEYVLKIDELLNKDGKNSEPPFEFELILPENSTVDLNLQNIPTRRAGALKSGYFFTMPWEQCILPLSLKKNQTLLSLANLSPVFLRNSVVMMADAHYFSLPDPFSNWVKIPYKITLFLAGKFAKKIVTISEFSKNQLVEYNIARADKISVIHIGCDHLLRFETDEKILDKHQLRHKRYFVAQSNPYPFKNIAVLFKAFASEALKDITLVLYGAASREDFERFGMTAPTNVIFTGRASDEELKALIQHATATLTPSLTEGFGLQPLEGMALGTPAIVAPCGAMPEVCGDAALYADPHKPEEWATLILKLTNDAAFTNNLKEKIKLHWPNFSWETAAIKLLDLLKNLK